ncbi:hypothetical protein WICMUC_001822 [Wickerhamomyces mucosus]|uniref:ATP-dependent DNA helicase CHL1 n=1 Tax=Wickerhamomyces mucosus TaxID=1378264 RepID=A0A9P8TG77_9ASCO|nr:hypothetical protein WICMUC_001822 [Wickerhamomyces mucosus]
MKPEDKYYHPYDPYTIQLEFMDAIDEVLTKNYKVGIFESPTGTGKTLSLICSTMTWLRMYESNSNYGITGKGKGGRWEEKKGNDEQSNNNNDNGSDDDDDEPDWIKESYQRMQTKSKNDIAEAYENRLSELSKQKKKVHRIQNERLTKRPKTIEIEISDDQFIPQDYHSENEDRIDGKDIQDRNSQISQEVKNLINKIEKRGKDEENGLKQDVKIFFASRTHSQLSQFSSQLKIPNFPPSLNIKHQHLKYLPLGSRRQLCINEKVSRIKDLTLLNEACLDLQKGESENRCKYYPSQRQESMQSLAVEFRDKVFTHVHDIEELPELGKDLGVCPYYSIRKGIPNSEIITLPYQLLLQKSSRETLGISVKDSIVIIDEAHNLLDTVTSIHSVSVKLDELKLCKTSLKTYLSKFSKRMNSGNRINLMKLVKIIDIIIKYAEGFQKIMPGTPISLVDMFAKTTGDLLNIHKLDKYLAVSKIAYKIESYMNKEDRSNIPLLFKIVDFLKSMSNPSKEGKFFFDVKDNDTIYLNYMLLDPSQVFKDIVVESKCVILAGGTMEPTSDYTDYLFPYIDSKLIKKFSCGHVIPEDNLKVFAIEKYNLDFHFSFDKRNDTKMITDLGECILKLIEKIPKGVVVFLPSYRYLSTIIAIWQKTDVYEKIDKVKKIYFESIHSKNDVLNDYSTSIANGHGTMLLSVVGGKLSEGINFSDDLARSVMIIGLPFPNLYSGEIISKRKYIESEVLIKTKSQDLANHATRNFYENLCMKAVNQSVGRSIRHINDYSTIYLFDKRFKSEKIEYKLSEWIKKRLMKNLAINEVIRDTEEFFKNKN